MQWMELLSIGHPVSPQYAETAGAFWVNTGLFEACMALSYSGYKMHMN